MKATDRALQRWRIRRALAWIPAGSRVLDVGCSDGALFAHGADRISSGVGIDLLPPVAWVGAQAERRTGSFPAALRAGETFDAIVMLAVVEHVDEQELKEWARECVERLHPGGRVVITVPSPLVDRILDIGMALHILDGMETEQHHGMQPRVVPDVFAAAGLTLVTARRFQLGLNNLFVFSRDR
jgi:2-polyprenyl-3-methyl-5-hydroxy-6-metoxy-1,4-benzoquinol methylase